MEEGESAVKQVLSTLWSYLYSSLPPNEDFIIQLEIGGILARNDATKLRASARLGGRACTHDLITFMYDFFDEPALETFCTFLDKYICQPNRPLMLAEVAAKTREEIGRLKFQQVHVLAPKDPQKRTSRARADVDVTVVKSVSDLMPYYMDMTAHLFELAAALEVVELSRALIDGHGTPQDKCLQILSHWLESTPSPTWALLCQKLGVASCFVAVVHNIARDHNLPTAAHTVPSTSVPVAFPPGSPEPPAPYTPAPTTLSPGTSVPGPTAPGASMSSPPTSGNHTSSASMSRPVYYPVIDKLKTSFSNLAGNVLSIIGSLSSKNLETFRDFLSNYLKPSNPPDAPLSVIPETVKDLKLFLNERWDPLQITLLKAVVEHLGSRKIQNPTFKASVQEVKADLNTYEDMLKSKLPEFLSKCRSEMDALKSYPGHSSVSVKSSSKAVETSLARIIELQDFFIDQLGLPDTLFTGFSEGCIVLFFSIPTECVWSLPSCLHPTNLSLLEEWKVLFISVKGAFTVDIKERRVIDSLDKHSLLSSLSEYKTLTKDLQTKEQQRKKDQYLKEEEFRVMEREVKVLRKGKGKTVTTVQEIEEKVSFKEESVVKTEPSPDVESEPSSKRFKTAGPDYLPYEPPLEKKAEAEKPQRNWKELRCQKTLECGRRSYQSIAVQRDVVCVGVEGRVLLFSKTSGAQVGELGSHQIKGVVYGVAFIDKDTFVVSADKRLRTYTTKGKLVRIFDSEKDGFHPRGLTVGPDGSIFVCDYGNHCVSVFNIDGKLQSSFGSSGSGDGNFSGPRDVCMDGDGLLFISDQWNSRICVHSVKGAFVREFGTPRKPRCVAATHCNHLVVSSASSDTVMIMTTSGQLVHEFGGLGSGPGQFRGPLGVAVDNEDCVYVCDGGNKRVQVY